MFEQADTFRWITQEYLDRAQEEEDVEVCALMLARHNEAIREATGVDAHWE